MADPYVNLDAAALFALPSWTACQGPAPERGALKIDVSVLLPIMICVGKTDEDIAIRTLEQIAKTLTTSQQFQLLPAAGRVELAEMQIYASHREFSKAMSAGGMGVFYARQWSEVDGYRLADDEQKIFWDMLTDDMRNVILAHGGLRSSNIDARPNDWKSDGAMTLWSYKTGGAVVTTYVFTDGKLTQTLKP